MGEVEAGADVAMWRRRRDPCAGHRERRSLLEGLLPVLLACLLYVGIFGDVAHGSTDVYDKLESFGFPSGLLPHIVVDYELDSNGKFTLYLEGKCELDIPSVSFPVVYSEKITGTVSYGSLKNLSGIQVKILYFWLSITAIEVDGDSLRFEVGYFSASYPIHPNFDENPGCVNILFSEPEALGYRDGETPALRVQ